MSSTLETPVEPTAAAEPVSTSPSKGIDWSAIVRSPAFLPGVLLAIGMILVYLPLCRSLWDLWMQGDGYYSHGVLVPLISGYVIYRAWPRIHEIKVKPAWIALLPVLALTWVGYRAGVVGINLIMSAAMIGTILFGIAFVAGWRWMLALSPATLYLAFAMPFWNSAIDAYTNPLQKISTTVAYQFLKLANLNPLMVSGDDTSILLDRFQLNVAVPCSGLKLVLALTAFVVFFVLVARLKWWANATLLASILPMALVFNGLRIALIGVVGNTYGTDAGLAFHDYSGYITLLVCFFVLFKFARALGWQD